MADQHKLLTLTDGQQVLVMESDFIKVDVGIINDDGFVGVEKSEDMNVTPEEYHILLEEAMTKTIEVDTITGKAQALTITENDPEINDSPQDKNKLETQE